MIFKLLYTQTQFLYNFQVYFPFLINNVCIIPTFNKINFLSYFYYIESLFQQANFMNKMTIIQISLFIEKSYINRIIILFPTTLICLQSKNNRCHIFQIMMLEILFFHQQCYSIQQNKTIQAYSMKTNIRIIQIHLQHFLILFSIMKRISYFLSSINQCNSILMLVDYLNKCNLKIIKENAFVIKWLDFSIYFYIQPSKK
ncbi:unnamed protein product [Paramecium primaurelia]|uniref:Uncharacterized protein n=1 Tax=Paramecium primaurelia TaxID=5886 RepID=A0A8S1PAJ6_PARPR|nr:unnamed protein product [Paramecium primaurelia]